MARARTGFAVTSAVTSGVTRTEPVACGPEAPLVSAIDERLRAMLVEGTQAGAKHNVIASELQRSRRHNLSNLHQLRASMIEHARILEAIRAREERRTARAFGQHVLADKRRSMDAVAADAAD